MRTMLTAIGISIGIAALVAVVGISASSKADLLAELDKLGTNLLQVRAGQSIFGDASRLPDEAPAMVRRIGPVEEAASTATVPGATVRRTDHVDEAETGGIAVVAADLELLETVAGNVDTGALARRRHATGAGRRARRHRRRAARDRLAGGLADGVDRRPMVRR